MILTDTGYWLALANARDKYHTRAIEVSRGINDELLITWPVITETCHLLAQRLYPGVAVKFLHQVKQTTTIFEIDDEGLNRCQVLMSHYLELPMDLADASLVLAAEEWRDGRILSTDKRDFQTYRWKNSYPFTNLLLAD